MDKELIKNQVKLDMGGVMAINPQTYREYLDWLASAYSISRDEARDIVKQALNKLPCDLD